MYTEHSYILFLCTRPERCCLLVNACPDWQPPPKSQTWTTDRTRPNNQLVNKWKSPSVRHKSTAQDVSSVPNPGLSLVGSVQIFRQVALSLKPWILRQVCAKRIYHPTYCARRQKRADNQPYRCYWWHRRALFLWSHIDRSANLHSALVLGHLSGCLHPHFDFNWKRLFIAWFGGYCNRSICHAAMLSHCTQRLCHASTLWQNLWLSTT